MSPYRHNPTFPYPEILSPARFREESNDKFNGEISNELRIPQSPKSSITKVGSVTTRSNSITTSVDNRKPDEGSGLDNVSPFNLWSQFGPEALWAREEMETIMTNMYSGDPYKASHVLGIPAPAVALYQTQRRPAIVQQSSIFSRMSSALSMCPAEKDKLTAGQIRELGRIMEDNCLKHSLDLDLEAVRSAVEPPEPPDGGAMAWWMTVFGHFGVFNTFGLNMSFGVFQAYYENTMHHTHSPAQIAWIDSVQIFCLFFMALIARPLIDKGYFRYCFAGGSMTLVLSMVITSFCTRYWQLLLIQGFVMGVSMGFVFFAGIIAGMGYFSKRIGLATAIGASGSSLGGIVYPLLGQDLVFKIGFAWTTRGVQTRLSLCGLSILR